MAITLHQLQSNNEQLKENAHRASLTSAASQPVSRASRSFPFRLGVAAAAEEPAVLSVGLLREACAIVTLLADPSAERCVTGETSTCAEDETSSARLERCELDRVISIGRSDQLDASPVLRGAHRTHDRKGPRHSARPARRLQQRCRLPPLSGPRPTRPLRDRACADRTRRGGHVGPAESVQPTPPMSRSRRSP